MKKIAEIKCGNGECEGKLSIYLNGSWKVVGKHNHSIDKEGQGWGYLPELRGKSYKEKIYLLSDMYSYSGFELIIY